MFGNRSNRKFGGVKTINSKCLRFNPFPAFNWSQPFAWRDGLLCCHVFCGHVFCGHVFCSHVTFSSR